jgi:RHS repeat-associated protein
MGLACTNLMILQVSKCRASVGSEWHLESTNQTLGASYRYDPFGNTFASSGAMASVNAYRFSSKEIHDYYTLYYYGYRFYNPITQRWLNRDPVHEIGFLTLKGRKQGWHEKAELNLYGMVRNDPVDLFDPMGLVNWGPAGGKCCNDSDRTEWWIDDGKWKSLGAGKCTVRSRKILAINSTT